MRITINASILVSSQTGFLLYDLNNMDYFNNVEFVLLGTKKDLISEERNKEKENNEEDNEKESYRKKNFYKR